ALVFNELGLASSASARLEISLTPRFLLPPRSTDSPAGSNVLFRAAAIGVGGVTYQWMREGRVIKGATSSELAIAGAQVGDSGNYSVEARDSAGNAFSSPSARLRVLIKPTLVSTPQSVTAVPGGVVSFSVAATGQPLPLVYRWRRGTTLFRVITNNSNVGVLILTNVQASDAGKYSVSVTNIAGSSATSADAVLTLAADFDQDGLPDSWEAFYGFNTNAVNEASIDSDQDGMSNRDEFVAGTDPNDVHSVLRLQGQALGSTATLLRFTAMSNHTYSLLLREDLVGSGAFTISNLTAAVTNRSVEILDPYPIGHRRYYSVVTPLQPDTRAGGPTVLSRLRDVVASSGQPTRLTIVAAGRGALRYEWYHNDQFVPWATEASVSWNSVQLSNAGRYRVRVFDSLGFREMEATLTVVLEP
ncbi:MAG: immunoglobulin domain-containing protein, partial [Verrucomicrobia bacterium]|nr:immunoglobulin domain-containing protein [Verrucomicrobiota bacterium]